MGSLWRFLFDISKMTLGSLSLFEINKEEAPSFVNTTDRDVAHADP